MAMTQDIPQPLAAKPRRKGRPDRQVAMAFPIAPAHLHAVMRGVIDYAGRHGGWLLTTHGESPDLPITSLRGWRGDGIIAILTTPAEARVARHFQKQGIPVVTFSGTLPQPGVPRVRVDNLAIGRLAAEHLLGRGYQRFGFYGLRGVAYAESRGSAFTARLAQAGMSCSMHHAPSTFGAARRWENEMQSLVRWIRRLPRPVGIFAVNDYRAQLVARACSLIGIRVPRDLGVIGADNNQILCEFNAPTLTSIDCNWYSIGFKAADLLDRLMTGHPAPAEDLLISPKGAVQRASTDFRVVEDARLVEVLDYVRAHLGEVFGVERLIAAAGASRRTLESAFLRELGCSPYHYLCQQRVERAKRLLEESPRATLTEIARRCGFHDARRFREVFRRLEGTNPAHYLQSLLRSGAAHA